MKALIVDTDLGLVDLAAHSLRQHGFDVVMAHDGRGAIQRWITEKPNLIILDVDLPKLDGLSVTRHIRAHSDVPIILISEYGSDEDVVRGLESGADDYLLKPVSKAQLIARCKAILRRTAPAQKMRPMSVGELILDQSRRKVVRGSMQIQLTPLEYRLLEVLARHPEEVLPTEQLIDSVWGINGGDKMMLKQLVHRLRRKIEVNPSKPLIETVSGVGYSLIAASAAAQRH